MENLTDEPQLVDKFMARNKTLYPQALVVYGPQIPVYCVHTDGSSFFDATLHVTTD